MKLLAYKIFVLFLAQPVYIKLENVHVVVLWVTYLRKISSAYEKNSASVSD